MPLEGFDLEDYPDPLDPPPWIDHGEGRPRSINMSMAGIALKKKMNRKIKVREVTEAPKDELEEKVEVGRPLSQRRRHPLLPHCRPSVEPRF